VDTVTIRELRNHGGEVVDKVAAGRRVVVTRDGQPVAELRPLRSRGVPAALLLERWRHVPVVDARSLREDLDSILDPWL
jgi:prevent-host-death family protein